MNISRALVLVVGLLGGLSSGCYVHGRARVVHYVEAEPVVFVDSPDLVYVEPGVYVVRDYDHAVYYVDGYYYTYRGGVWYHSAHWSDPWITVHVGHVPGHIAHRRHDHYVHYRGSAHAHVIRDERPRRHAANPTSSGGGHHSASAGHSKPKPVDGGSKPMKATAPDRFDPRTESREAKVSNVSSGDVHAANVEKHEPRRSPKGDDDRGPSKVSASSHANDAPSARAPSKSSKSMKKTAPASTRKSSGKSKKGRR